MANRTFSRVQALNHGVKVISGTIICDEDAPALTDATLVGLGFTAADDSNSVKITLGDDADNPDKYISLMSATANAKLVGDPPNTVIIKAHDVSSAGTVTLEIMSETAGTFANHPMVELDELHFTLVLRNNSADSR